MKTFSGIQKLRVPNQQTKRQGVLKGSSFNRETPDGNVGPQNNVKSPENAAMWGVRTFLI